MRWLALNLFTSDLHIGHENVIKHCNRPFDSVEEMNETLVANWNRKVHKNDDVYIVGDMFFRSSITPSEFLDRLKGRKHLVIGNHDKSWLRYTNVAKYFVEVEHLIVFNDGNRWLTLSHYPMMAWRGSCTKGFLIYGHIHNAQNDTYWPLLKTMKTALNAGVDVNGFEPVTFNELVENNRKRLEGLL